MAVAARKALCAFAQASLRGTPAFLEQAIGTGFVAAWLIRTIHNRYLLVARVGEQSVRRAVGEAVTWVTGARLVVRPCVAGDRGR